MPEKKIPEEGLCVGSLKKAQHTYFSIIEEKLKTAGYPAEMIQGLLDDAIEEAYNRGVYMAWAADENTSNYINGVLDEYVAREDVPYPLVMRCAPKAPKPEPTPAPVAEAYAPAEPYEPEVPQM